MSNVESAYIDGNYYKIGFRGRVYVQRVGGDWCLCLTMKTEHVKDAIKKQKKRRSSDTWRDNEL